MSVAEPRLPASIDSDVVLVVTWSPSTSSWNGTDRVAVPFVPSMAIG